jgi:hypothetical protein
MARATEVPLSATEAKHTYQAEATVLSADFEQPVRETIKPRVHVKLPIDGHYKFKPATSYRLKGIISYRSGYSQVAGHKSAKTGGFTTLATSVVEGLNVLDVLTADRVVGQISTTHPPYVPAKGYSDPVPSVTFLGTRFDNLRIGGHKVEVERHLDILGSKSTDGKSYFEDEDVLARIAKQYDNIKSAAGLPDWAKERYRWDRAAVQQGKAECSLVNGVKESPGICFGHVIDLPHFGRIFLGELTVNRTNGKPAASKLENQQPDKYRFHLTMIRLELGCLAQGSASVVTTDTNGTGRGGGGTK